MCDDTPDLCYNDGTCTDTLDGFKCLCSTWIYKGRRCGETKVHFYIKHALTGKYLTVKGKTCNFGQN